MSKIGWVKAAGLLALALAAAGGARAGVDALVPQAREMGPPDWLRSGVRVVYYVASAGVRQTYEHPVLDPNGDWVNPRTGDHYRKDPTAPGTAGQGFLAMDAVSVDQRQAVISIHNWLLAAPGGMGAAVAMPRSLASAIGPAGAADDWYVNPKAFAALKPAVTKDTAIVPMPYQLDGKTYQAVGLSYHTEHSYTSSIYDLATGIMLASSGSVEGGDLTVEGGATHTTFFMSRFKGLRQLKLPWAGTPLPAWIGGIHTIAGTGALRVASPGGMPPMVLPVRIQNQIRDHGADWVRFDHSQTVSALQPNMPPQVERSTIVSGPAAPGSLWLPPAALAALRPGQEIDQDALLGTQTVCAGATGGQVVIRETGAAHTTDLFYDLQSGALVRVRSEDRSITSMILDVPLNEGQ
jgi:hypothetical protein